MLKHACLALLLASFLGAAARGQDVNAAIARLQNGKDADKVAAAVTLADLGPKAEPAVPALITALQGKNEDVRLNCALALGRIGAPAVKPLGALLAGDRSSDRFYAVWALGMIGPAAKETAPAVVKLLADRDEHVRRKAAFALGRIGPEPQAAIGPLIGLLADANGDVRQSASEALARFGAQGVPALIDALKSDSPALQREAARALGRIGSDAKDAVPQLKTVFLTAGNASAEAAEALGHIGKPAIPALVECVTSPAAEVRKKAVQVLGTLGADAVPSLVDALADKNADVRQAAAAALAPLRIGDKMVVLALAHGVHDSDQAVRRQCLTALQNLGPAARLAAPKLVAALKDSDGPNRLQIILVLQNLGEAEREVLPVAAGLLKDADPQIRQSAVNLLARQGSPALPHLIAALKDNSPLVRFAAVAAIQRVPGDIKDAQPALTQLLKDGAVFQRRSVVVLMGRVGAPAVPSLIELLKDDQNVIRSAAIDALRTIGPDAKKAAPKLIDIALQDSYVPARRNAVAAVAAIEPEKLGDLFARVKKHGDDKVRETAYQGLYYRVGKSTKITALPAKLALPHLIDATKDAAVTVRILAANGLGNLGPDAKEALPALTALAQDENPAVRAAANSALAQIKGKS